jgi:hypothetical protein
LFHGWGDGALPGIRRYDGEEWLLAIRLEWIKRVLFDPPRPRTALSIRRDWPDGTHDLQGIFHDRAAAEQQLVRDSERLRGAEIQPRHSVVTVTERAYYKHRATNRCRQRCPEAPRPRTPLGWEFTGGVW